MRTWALDLVNGSDSTPATTQATYAISAATKANPCQVTITGHGFNTGDYVYIAGVSGMTQLNNAYYTVTKVDANNVTLDGINSTGYSTYTSGGTMYSSITRASIAVVTMPGHGYVDGQLIYAAGFGMSQINSLVFKVYNAQTSRFSLRTIDDVDVNSTAYTTNGVTMGNTTVYSYRISGITKANPAVVTCSKHNFSNGQKVYLSVEGMTQLDTFVGTVANKTDTTFELSGVDSSAFGTFTSGTVRRAYLTGNTLNAVPTSIMHENASATGSTIYVAKTFTPGASVQVNTIGNVTFQDNNANVTTTLTPVGVISVGDYIGLTTAVGNGCASDPRSSKPDLYYKVQSVSWNGSTGTIVLTVKYQGGSNTTVATIARLRSGTEIVTTGSASASAMTLSTTNVTWDGGYDFSGGTITRNGETWFQLVTQNADLYCVTLNGASNVFQYMNPVNGYRGIINNVASNAITRCFSYATNYTGYYNTYSSGATNVTYCSGISQGSSSFGVLYLGGFDYCYAVSSTAIGGYLINPNGIMRRCLAEGGSYGYEVAGKLIDCKFRNHTYGVTMDNDGYAENIVGSGATYGTMCANPVRGVVIKGYDISSCTYGHYTQQTSQVTYMNGTCTSCGRDFGGDQYAIGQTSYGHTSVTPTTWAFDFSAKSTWKIFNFTIDAPSIAKAFSSGAATGSTAPQYALQSCSQFADGQYYASGSIQKDTSDTYNGGAWSLKMMIAGSSVNNGVQVYVISYPVASGASGTITYYLKKNASFTGSLTPTLWLANGIVKSGTAIAAADMSSSAYTQFTITFAAGDIPQDGLLTFGFIHTGSVHAINIDTLSGGIS